MDETVGLEEFVRARGAALSRFAYLLTCDHEAAQDLVQAALVKVVPRWRRIAGGHPEAYLRRVIYHEHVSWWHRRRRYREQPLDRDSEPPASGDEVASADLRVALTHALARLKSRQRAVIILRYYEDRSIEETAQILGIPTGTVKAQAHRGLAALRRIVPGLGPGSDDTAPPHPRTQEASA